jgi:hypothetical protein
VASFEADALAVLVLDHALPLERIHGSLVAAVRLEGRARVGLHDQVVGEAQRAEPYVYVTPSEDTGRFDP